LILVIGPASYEPDVVEKLRAADSGERQLGLLFSDYDSGGNSPRCEHVGYSWNPSLAGWCADGMIDPTTGALLATVAAAVAGTGD
jgi:hypothetical protein